jgi:hypothetical protein
MKRQYPSAIDEIVAERRRQIEDEGWSSEHDDAHVPGALSRAGACYAKWAVRSPNDYRHSAGYPPEGWPWSPMWWKPRDVKRDLVRAAALIVAEIERLDRLAALQSEKDA